jgi:hypothetical protein
MLISCKRHRYVEHIVDTDFEINEPVHDKEGGWEAIIRVYERKNLNVASNLLRAIMYYCMGVGQPIVNVFNNIKNDKNNTNPNFHKYVDDIEKYLMLI